MKPARLSSEGRSGAEFLEMGLSNMEAQMQSLGVPAVTYPAPLRDTHAWRADLWVRLASETEGP